MRTKTLELSIKTNYDYYSTSQTNIYLRTVLDTGSFQLW